MPAAIPEPHLAPSSSSRAALLIDDNDGYAALLLSHFEPRDFLFSRARSAADGLKILKESGANAFRLIVTDITMEGQTAGLKLIRQIRRIGYRGVLVVASTGFDSPFVLRLAKPFLAWWGVDVLIPKRPLKAGELRCSPVTLRGKFWEASYL